MSTVTDSDQHGGRDLPNSDLSNFGDTSCSAFVGRNVALWWEYYDSAVKASRWRWNAYTPTYNTADDKGRNLNGRQGITDRATAELEARAAAIT